MRGTVALLVLALMLAGCTQPEMSASGGQDEPPQSTDSGGSADDGTQADDPGSGSQQEPEDPEEPQEPTQPQDPDTRQNRSAPGNATTLAPNATAPEPFEPTWAASAEDAVLRPGAPIGWCTYNFLFWAPNGSYYIGTAAHCTDEVGQRMPLPGHGDIGTVVYDSDFVPASERVDFSLVVLDPGVNLLSHPQMVNHDGPTGWIEIADMDVGDELQHHGYALVWGDTEATRDRPGYISGFSGRDYCAESPVWWGDSGSPVLHAETGQAMGIVSRAGWTSCIPAAQVMGATVGYILDELAASGWHVELATA